MHGIELVSPALTRDYSLKTFRAELKAILPNPHPKPNPKHKPNPKPKPKPNPSPSPDLQVQAGQLVDEGDARRHAAGELAHTAGRAQVALVREPCPYPSS